MPLALLPLVCVFFSHCTVHFLPLEGILAVAQVPSRNGYLRAPGAQVPAAFVKQRPSQNLLVGWLVQASKPNALSITCSHCTWPSCLYLPGCSFWQEALQHPSKPRRYGHRERLLLIAGSCCLPYCLLPRCQLPKCGLLHCLAAIVSRPLPLHPNPTAPHLLSAELTAVVPPVL